MSNIPAIEAMLSDYFYAIHTQDMEKIDRVFHKNVVLYNPQTCELNIRP